MTCFARSLSVALVLLWLVTAQAGDEPISFGETERKLILSLSPLPPALPDPTNRASGNPQAVQLGRRLFFDTRLSGSGQFACASCHDPAKGWTDRKTVATAAGTKTRNTPALWNVAHNRWFFWDGRADSLWSQALKPLEDPDEQNTTRLQIAHLIGNEQALRTLYTAVFGPFPDLSDEDRFPRAGGPISRNEQLQLDWAIMEPEDQETVNRIFVNAGKAIAAFEGTIRTGDAPFDRYVADLRAGAQRSAAIPAAAQRGLATFIGKGNCVLCHSGPNFTDREFHDTRIAPANGMRARDEGRRAGITLLSEDEFMVSGPFSDDPFGKQAKLLAFLDPAAGVGHFKTPSLRNVATTAPYMHAGQLQSLRDVVRHYSTLADAAAPADPAHVEALIRPLNLSDAEIDDVVAFLESLTSEPDNQSGNVPGAAHRGSVKRIEVDRVLAE